MTHSSMAHPQLLRALVTAGHGSRVLLADANCPHTTGVSPCCELVSLSFAPGMFDIIQILEVLKQVYSIEKAETMVPAPDAPQMQIPIYEEFRAQLPDTEFAELSRFDFYDAARSKDVGIITATGKQRLYGSLLLTVGVRMPGQ